MTCEFLGITHYSDSKECSGEMKVTLDINEPLKNRHVIVFKDLIDSEKVFSYMMRTFEARKPATVKYCCLLLNSQNKKINEDIDYVGFKINQANIVGYGIDTPEKLARLPYIGYFEDAH
jgi:hypoxanthine phosphoribosyltransferase